MYSFEARSLRSSGVEMSPTEQLENGAVSDHALTKSLGECMIPTTILGGFALLTSLAIPEVEHAAARGEARIELLGCLTRNVLGLEGALSSEAFRQEILSRCRPVLP